MSQEHLPKILLLEDDPDLLLMLKIVLEKAGYEVECISNGTAIVNNKVPLPDLYIIDKGLQVIDGIAICKYLKLKKETNGIPIIMISANDYQEKALRAGANYFIDKPIDMQKLLQTIHTLLEQISA